MKAVLFAVTGDVTEADWIVSVCVCESVWVWECVLKMSSQCLFWVLVLCSLQSPGLHLTLESMAAIPEVIYESLLSPFWCFNSTRKNVFYFVSVWLLRRSRTWEFGLCTFFSGSHVGSTVLIIEWMWRRRGDAVSCSQPAAVGGGGVAWPCS